MRRSMKIQRNQRDHSSFWVYSVEPKKLLLMSLIFFSYVENCSCNQGFDLNAFILILYCDASSRTMKFHGKMHSTQTHGCNNSKATHNLSALFALDEVESCKTFQTQATANFGFNQGMEVEVEKQEKKLKLPSSCCNLHWFKSDFRLQTFKLLALVESCQ